MTGDRNDLLLGRLIRFAQKTIRLCQKLPKSPINSRLVSQAVGSTGSMASNYGEACEAESSLDFVYKIKIAKKEARESRVNLLLLHTANSNFSTEIEEIGRENNEYIKIFSTIVKNSIKKK